MGIQAYCEAAAGIFDFTPEQLRAEGADGFDQRHEWHDAHRGFVDLIERLLADALLAEEIDRAAFLVECQVAIQAPDRAPTMNNLFLSLLFESGDYAKFLQLMKMQHQMRAQMAAFQQRKDEEDWDDEEEVSP